jgi:hypothetical protein
MSIFILAAFLVSLLSASGYAAMPTCSLKIVPKTDQIIRNS